MKQIYFVFVRGAIKSPYLEKNKQQEADQLYPQRSMFSWFTCNFLLVCVFLVSSLLPMSSGSVLRSRPGCLVICDDNMRLFSFCRGIKLFSRTTKPSTVPMSVFGAFIWCFSNSCCICCFLSLFHWKVRGLDQADLVQEAIQHFRLNLEHFIVIMRDVS